MEREPHIVEYKCSKGHSRSCWAVKLGFTRAEFRKYIEAVDFYDLIVTARSRKTLLANYYSTK